MAFDNNKYKEYLKTDIWKNKRKERLYFLKQKLLGLLMTGIGVLIPIVLDGDATGSILMIPLGLYAIFTKNKIMYF